MDASSTSHTNEPAVSRSEFNALMNLVKEQQKERDELLERNAELTRQVDWFRRQLFGSKSEKQLVDNPYQMHLGEQFEPSENCIRDTAFPR